MEQENLQLKIELLEQKVENYEAKLRDKDRELGDKQNLITRYHSDNTLLRAEIESLNSWKRTAIEQFNLPVA